MPTQLHILTRPADDLVNTVLATERERATVSVEVVDLTQPDPDYADLVDKVFAADSVATW